MGVEVGWGSHLGAPEPLDWVVDVVCGSQPEEYRVLAWVLPGCCWEEMKSNHQVPHNRSPGDTETKPRAELTLGFSFPQTEERPGHV